MSLIAITPPVGQTFARAKALLKRDETLRALETMLGGLEELQRTNLPGRTRFEVEVTILECVQDLNRQPIVREFFEALSHGKNVSIPYKAGEEKKLAGVLGLVNKGLREKIEQAEENEKQRRLDRKAGLEQKGLEYLRSGDSPRGKAALRLLAEEFGQEPGVLAQVGEWLMEAKLYFEAAEILERAMEEHPKEVKSYTFATQCYLELREYQKAENVYLRVIKQFGKHPRTMLNLAKLYLSWNKKEEAFNAALEAWNKDNSLAEAKEIVDKYA